MRYRKAISVRPQPCASEEPDRAAARQSPGLRRSPSLSAGDLAARCGLPAAAERTEQIDLRVDQPLVGFGQIGFGLRQRPLGIEHCKAVGAAFAELGAGDPRRLLRLIAGGLERAAPLDLVGIA